MCFSAAVLILLQVKNIMHVSLMVMVACLVVIGLCWSIVNGERFIESTLQIYISVGYRMWHRRNRVSVYSDY